jgi:hypothetical protein
MTFVKPSTITVSPNGSPYGYKGTAQSPAQNYIDRNFPNILDKTGDEITGELIIESGGSIQTNGGSIVINSGDVLSVVNTGAIEASGTSTFISVLTGANLLIDSTSNMILQGNCNVAGSGSMYFFSGSLLHMKASSILDGYGYLNLRPGSTTNFLSTVNTISWPIWTAPQSRTITQPIQVGQSLSGSWDAGIQYVSSNSVGSQWVCCLDRMHNGATLNQVVINFQVWQTHSGVPANLPSISVLRYDNSVMASAAALGIPDPQAFFPPPASGSAWYDSQNTQYLVYECVHNNVIDNSQYSYFVVVTDESGSNSLPENNYGMITLSFNGIPDQSWQL